MTRAHSWKIGAEMLPDFVVARELGRGGMGAVLLVDYRPTGQQYAVKTAILSDTKARQQFMAELRRWHELPPNPHLVRCYFSREIENRVHIFAEYVRGGSLDQWIRMRWISTVMDMLDVAIQLARALQALHDQDLVHHDVKPQNVLIADDGKVKLTDFGLAQTTEYRSPEQATSGRVDQRTDQWSWALTVLFMFSGERTWLAGETGALAFEDYVGNIDDDAAARPRMPEGLIATVKRALLEDPAQRWPKMSAIADALAETYKTVTGSVHFMGSLASRARVFAAIVAASGLPEVAEKQSIGASVQWRDDASSYLQSRSVSAELEAVLEAIVEGRSREAQTVEQLRKFDEVQRQAEALWNSNKQDLSALEALLSACEKKAALHHRNGDLRKAIEYLQRAAEAIDQGGESVKPEHLETQTNAYRRRGLLLAELGDYKTALESLEQAIIISNKLQDIMQHAPRETRIGARVLAVRVPANKGFILLQSGQSERALDALETALSYATENLLAAVPALRREVAQIYTRRGFLLRTKGKFSEAYAAIRNAAATLEKAPGEENFLHQDQLANVMMWQGLLHADMNKHADATVFLLRSIEIREKHVLPHDPVLGRIGLAHCGEVMGSIAASQGDWTNAQNFFGSAVSAWEFLVHEHGRNEYVYNLAIALSRDLEARKKLKIPLGDKLPRAQRLFEHLTQHKHTPEISEHLARLDTLSSDESNHSLTAQSSSSNPLSEGDDARVGLSSERPPARMDEMDEMVLSSPFDPPSFPLPPSFKSNVFSTDDIDEDSDREEYDEAFNALDSKSNVPGRSTQSSASRKNSRIIASATDDKIATVLERRDSFPATSRNPVPRQVWVPPKKLASPQSNSVLPAEIPQEKRLSKNNPPITIIARARFLPALVLAICASVAVVVLRQNVQPSVASNAVSLLGAAVFLYMMHVAWDGFSRRKRGVSSYTLTHEDFQWSDSALSEPIRWRLVEITTMELTSNRDVVLTVSARANPYRITRLDRTSLREWLIRPTSAEALFDALRSRVRKVNRTVSVIDARTMARNN